MLHFFVSPRKWACTALVLALAGCSRSAVVVTPETSSLADEPPTAAKVVRGQAEDAEPERFAFPDDAGGELLAKVLPPKDVEATPRHRPPSPRRITASALDEPPVLPLPTCLAVLPRLTGDDNRLSLRPRLVAEETLGVSNDAPPLPPTPPMPDNGRIRVPSPDVNRLIPLPLLARPASDRAALDDPTLDASTAAALAAPLPPRGSKAPFLKQTLPDPYDNRRTDVSTPEESKEFPVASPQTPKR
jgi:hypothetical protein